MDFPCLKKLPNLKVKGPERTIRSFNHCGASILMSDGEDYYSVGRKRHGLIRVYFRTTTKSVREDYNRQLLLFTGRHQTSVSLGPKSG
jgi:hypothetical protein